MPTLRQVATGEVVTVGQRVRYVGDSPCNPRWRGCLGVGHVAKVTATRVVVVFENTPRPVPFHPKNLEPLYMPDPTERDFLRAAACYLECRLKAMGGEVEGSTDHPLSSSRQNLEGALQGMSDHAWEMREVCRVARSGK